MVAIFEGPLWFVKASWKLESEAVMIRDKRVGGFDCVVFGSWLPGSLTQTRTSVKAASKCSLNQANPSFFFDDKNSYHFVRKREPNVT
jgi:hypothetical protein